MEILAMIGIVVAAVTFVSGVVGTWVSSDEKKRANSQDLEKDKCAQCKLDKEWYDSLPLYQQILFYGC
jgi:hypothetical protein